MVESDGDQRIGRRQRQRRWQLVIPVSSVVLLVFVALSLIAAVRMSGNPSNIATVTTATTTTKTTTTIATTIAATTTSDEVMGLSSTIEQESGVKGSQESIVPLAQPAQVPTQLSAQPPAHQPQTPIMALLFSGVGGPKHCRGRLIAKPSFPRPIEQWKNGTCVNVGRQANCGVFLASEDDYCEAHLFNVPDCHNTTLTYLNTVVFRPEEQLIGGLWNSMLVKCGVVVPPVKAMDPSLLGAALKKPSERRARYM